MDYAAYFKFRNNLNDFLRHTKKDTVITYHFNGVPAIKDAIEALGVPHTEVDVILVNGIAVHFYTALQKDTLVEVFPLSLKPPTSYSLAPPYVVPLRFIADVHLGKLVKALRMLGIDTLYQNDYSDKTIVDIAAKEDRIVLTRDVGLLKNKILKWGYWLRSQDTKKQLTEIIERFPVQVEVKPFTRCLDCNGSIATVTKEQVIKHLPPKTIEYFNEYYQCLDCGKVYWKGSHYENMVANVEGWIDSKR